MAKKSVLGHPDNVPRLSREGFNLNQIFTFTASTGMLLPVWYDLLNPGETIKGNPSFLLRSDHFLAPAMADVDCFVDLFFVPMQKILSPFGEWFYQIDDLRSDFLNSEDFTEYLPICTSSGDDHNPFFGMTKTAFNDRIGSNVYETFGFGLHRLLQHLGYNPQSLFYNLVSNYSWQDEDSYDSVLTDYQPITKNVSCPNFSPYLFCAYQGIYYDYYRNSDFEANNVRAYNLDSYFNGENDGEIPMDTIFDTDSVHRLDMFRLRYRWRSKDYFTASRLSPLASGVSMLPNGLNLLEQVNQWLANGSYDLYNQNYTANLLDPSNPADTYTQLGFKNNLLVGGSTSTPIYPIPPGASSSVLYNDGTLYSGPLQSNSQGYVSDEAGSSFLSVRTPHSHTFSASMTNALTTARIRTMFALEKLQRITARAGKHYDDQTLAHFGFKVNQGMSGEVYKIKSWHTTLGIQKVTSTADTQGAALGEQAAVGYSILDSRKDGFKFTAPCHGIVMAIWSAAPRYKYLGAVDKLGMKTKLWDFYKPSLDNLGSQPIFGYEFGGLHNKSTLYEDDIDVDDSVQSWQWRFMESKVKYDRVTQVFATTSKNPWSMTAIPTTLGFKPCVSPTDMNLLVNAQYDSNIVWPEDGLNEDHHTWVASFNKAYLRDPFTIDFFMKCSKVSTMSTFGDVSLNGI